MIKAIPLLLAAVTVFAQSTAVPNALAIRGARIITVSGPALNSGTVLIRDGLIQAVGEDVKIPADAWVIEGAGLNVYPGLIDGLSSWGIPEPPPATTRAAAPSGEGAPTPARGPEDRPLTTSWVRAADLVRTTDNRLEAARHAGFTTAMSFPQRGIFAGQGAAISLAAERHGGMVISAPLGQFVSLSTGGFSSYPGSLMGVIAYIRQVCSDADHYRRAKELYAANPRGLARPAYDRALEGVLESPRLLLPATGAVEIMRMLRFASELRREAVLYGGHEGYRAAEALKQAGVPILVSLRWPERPREADPDQTDSLRVLEMRELAPSTPAVLTKAGVRWAFYGGGVERPEEALRAVKRAMDAGLSRQDAVRGMTLAAAEIFGLGDRLGSIEAGKIANLVVTRGELFEEKTRVEFVVIDGVRYTPTPAQPATEGETEKK